MEICRIIKFQNSSADEGLQLVEQAELDLEAAEDGDALCLLLNGCVPWLRPAKFCREGDADTWSQLIAWNGSGLKNTTIE